MKHNNDNLHKGKPHASRMQGVSLIEVMIALLIGLILMSGAISLFINNKRIFRENDQMGRLQESARFAIGLLTSDIRHAGFLGCHHNILEVSNSIIGSGVTGSLFSIRNGDTSLGVEGLEAGANRWLPSGNTLDFITTSTVTGDGNRIAGTDAITVRYLSGENWDVLADNDNVAPAQGFMTTTAGPLVVSTINNNPQDTDDSPQDTAMITNRQNNFFAGELLAVSDCGGSHIFQAGPGCIGISAACTAANGAINMVAASAANIPGNNPVVFPRLYTEDAKVRRYNAARYYIGNGGYGGPSLYRQILRRTNTVVTNTSVIVVSQELIEGVENMQIIYGLDNNTDGVPDSYVVATDIAANQWDNVVAVRVALLLRSVTENFNETADNSTYDLLGNNINPADLQVRRRVFTTTIQLRNRIIDNIGN